MRNLRRWDVLYCSFNCGRTRLEHNPIAYYDNDGYLGKCEKFTLTKDTNTRKIKEIREDIVREINVGIDYSNGRGVWKGIDKLLTLQKEEFEKMIEDKQKNKQNGSMKWYLYEELLTKIISGEFEKIIEFMYEKFSCLPERIDVKIIDEEQKIKEMGEK